jgi:UTP-glucose-1-phosphate uridylyltransferase
VTASNEVRVVVAAGGLGTRVHQWARYLPKEFCPVGGRPGIAWLLDEIAGLGAAHVVIVHHPYYREFTEWARQALSPHGEARYLAAGGPSIGNLGVGPDLAVRFIAQRGRYADLTSVLNAADYFRAAGDLYVAFADNIYFGPNPLVALHELPSGLMAVVASAYQPELAAHRGVIATVERGGRRLLAGLTEKPSLCTARALEQRYGTRNLLLLEGRARVTADFIRFARTFASTPGVEPKLSLTIGAYAATHPVLIIETTCESADLGVPACHCWPRATNRLGRKRSRRLSSARHSETAPCCAEGRKCRRS